MELESLVTHFLLASTVFLTAWTNWSEEGDVIQSLSAPVCIRKAFWSGRKSVIRPSSVL